MKTKRMNIKNKKLTNRENEIFSLLLSGLYPKEIAGKLSVSYFTVDFHRKNLYRKLGVHSRTELFLLYIQSLAV